MHCTVPTWTALVELTGLCTQFVSSTLLKINSRTNSEIHKFTLYITRITSNPCTTGKLALSKQTIRVTAQYINACTSATPRSYDIAKSNYPAYIFTYRYTSVFASRTHKPIIFSVKRTANTGLQ